MVTVKIEVMNVIVGSFNSDILKINMQKTFMRSSQFNNLKLVKIIQKTYPTLQCNKKNTKTYEG